MSTMTNQIDFVCVRSDHQITTFVEALTINDDKWAYCPSAQTDGHEWRACGATGLEDLRTLLRLFPVTRIAAGDDANLIEQASPERVMKSQRPGVQWR
jgi:hypothetical protein